MIILIIHIIVSYMTRIVHWFFMWKMDSMSGCDTAVTSVLCLHYRPETVHCSIKDAHTSEITFFALLPRCRLLFVKLKTVKPLISLCQYLVILNCVNYWSRVLSTKQNIPCTFVQSMNNTCCNSFNVLYASTSNIILRIKNNE